MSAASAALGGPQWGGAGPNHSLARNDRAPAAPRYREAFLEGHHIYIVMDFAKNGDLHSRVKKLKARNRYFDEEHIWLAIIQILKGLKALHSQNILHRVRNHPWGSLPSRGLTWPRSTGFEAQERLHCWRRARAAGRPGLQQAPQARPDPHAGGDALLHVARAVEAEGVRRQVR